MIELEVDFSSLKRVVWAIESEQGTEKLKRQLGRDLRAAVQPAAEESKQSVLSMHSAGAPHQGESLRRDIASRVSTQARFSGDGAGVRVRVGWGGPRGFYTSARRVNRGYWRHPVFGNRNVWVEQIGKREWFETPLRAHRDDYRDAVLGAMEDMAERIAREV